MLSQLGLRSQTSTASFVVVSRASGSPSSPAALTPRPAPSLAVWRRALLFLAVLDLAVTLAFSGVLRSDKMLLLSTVAVTRAAVVAAVGCSRRSGTTGAGAGWVSATSALTVLVFLWELLNLLYQTRVSPAGLGSLAAAHSSAPVPIRASTLHTSSTMALSLSTAKLRDRVALLGANLAFALVEEATSFKVASVLAGARSSRSFGIRQPHQASSSFSFDVSSSRLESPDDSSLECLAGSDVESEDELSESEIVDIPPPEASTVTSSTTSSAGGKLERSLSRSWSRHRLRSSAGRAPLGSSQADQARAEEGDGYGTFLS